MICGGGSFSFAGARLVIEGVNQVGFARVGEPKLVSLKVVNTGREQISILSVKSSCPCVELVDKPEVINAGGEGKIVISCTPQATGLVEANLLFHTSVSEESPVVVKLSFTGIDFGKSSSNQVVSDKFVSARIIAGEMEDVPMSIVDVRDRSEPFDAAIPGSKAIPLSLLSKLLDRKDGNFVIYGSGLNDDEIIAVLSACRSGENVKIRVMSGGLRSWIQCGLEVDGDAKPPGLRIADIVRTDFLKFRFLVLGDKNSSTSHLTGFPIEKIAFEKFGDWLASDSSLTEELSPVIILNAASAERAGIERILRGKDSFVPVFFLSEDLEEFESWTAVQIAAQNHGKKSLVRIGTQRGYQNLGTHSCLPCDAAKAGATKTN